MGPWHFSEHWGLAPLLMYVKAERTNSSIQPRSQIDGTHAFILPHTKPSAEQEGI